MAAPVPNRFLVVRLTYSRALRVYQPSYEGMDFVCPQGANAFIVENTVAGIAHALTMIAAGSFGPTKPNQRVALVAGLNYAAFCHGAEFDAAGAVLVPA